MQYHKSILRHATMMVGRTLKSYALLSVTIVLSFALLLGYLVFTDSTLYNRYREIFAADRGMIYIRDIYLENAKLEMLLQKAEEIGDTSAVWYDCAQLNITRNNLILPEQGIPVNNPLMAEVFVLPQHTFAFCEYGARPWAVHWLDGKEHPDIHLEEGEVIVDEDLYYALELDKMDEPTYTFHFCADTYGSPSLQYEARIVGYLKDNHAHWEFSSAEVDGTSWNLSNGLTLLLSTDAINQSRFPADEVIWARNIVVYSDSPEEVVALAEKLDFTGKLDANCIAQNQALEKIQTANQTKAIITAALLLLLGINLYSCFSNALNDRKFEIGVKRAIGASRWAIVRQFLYESILVMGVNILLSVSVVTDVFLVYKYHLLCLPKDQGQWLSWTIWCSPWSVGMFAVCAIALTVVFSLIFAYKSTQVQVVDYLKSE